MRCEVIPVQKLAMAKPLIFISHMHAHEEFVNALQEQLDDALAGGVRFFNSSDHTSLRPGDPWSDRLNRALRETKVVLVVASPKSVTSSWVNFEGGGGWIAGARVVPCCVAGMTPEMLPSPLNSLQALDLRTRRGVEDLVHVIADTADLRYPAAARLGSMVAALAEADRAIQDISSPTAEGHEGSFTTFIGTESRRKPVRLVFPIFEFRPDVKEVLLTLQPVWDKPNQHRTGRYTADAIEPVAANDLRALCSVAKVLGREEVSFQPMTDRDAWSDGGEFPIISFGMTTNDITQMYVDLTAASGRRPLFEPRRLADGSATVRLPTGTDLEYDNDRYGLVARATPHVGHDGRKWLFCAGLGRTGTEAAANYLCGNWRRLDAVVGEKDFVAVVKCTSGNPRAYHCDIQDVFFDDGSSP